MYHHLAYQCFISFHLFGPARYEPLRIYVYEDGLVRFATQVRAARGGFRRCLCLVFPLHLPCVPAAFALCSRCLCLVFPLRSALPLSCVSAVFVAETAPFPCGATEVPEDGREELPEEVRAHHQLFDPEGHKGVRGGPTTAA